MQNIELKARLADIGQAEATCSRVRAAFQGVIRQRDTYFNSRKGRLKVRRSEPGPDHLIYYRRDDSPEARASDYDLEPAPEGMEEMLRRELGQLAVVEKTRRLWLWENVRIHLDTVDALGTFIEFEAVLDEVHGVVDGHAKVAYLRDEFGITEADLVAGSYLDLMLTAAPPAKSAPA